MTNTVIQVVTAARVQWVAKRTQNGQYVAVCDALGITAWGNSEHELHTCIGEEIGLLFESLFAHNDLQDFLKERGWTLTRQPQPHEDVTFDLPFDLVSRAGVDHALA